MHTTPMKRTMLGGMFFLILVSIISVHTMHGQMVEVDPPRPVLYSKSRTVELTLTNPSNKPVDVNIGFEYVALRGDSANGNQVIDSNFTDEEKNKDCSSWLKVFPRRMVIPGRGSRTVRVLSSIPQEASDGEYQARIILNCELQNAPTEIPALDTAQNDVSLATSMSTMLSLPFAVRVGKFDTGLSIESVSARVDSIGRTSLLYGLRRSGNSPYRGTLTAHMINMGTSDTVTYTTGFTIEFKGWIGVWPNRKLKDGQYRVELTIESVRGGSYADLLINVPTITQTYTLEVSGDRATIRPEN